MANVLLRHGYGYIVQCGEIEETCLDFDGTAKPIYSAALLHMWSSTETANSLPFL